MTRESATQKEREGEMEREKETYSLIPGLPDDVALDCLARVSHSAHPGLRPVCRRWRHLLTSPVFHLNRLRLGAAEDLIFLVQALVPDDTNPARVKDDEEEEQKGSLGSAAAFRPPVYGLTLYNASTRSWHRVTTPEPLPLFAQIASVGRLLVLVGGWDPSTLEPVAGVRVLDLATGAWRRGEAMSVARSFFACAAAGGRVYVAGGHDGQKNALRSAEAYDVAKDEWSALPEMAEERDECSGVTAAGGRFWAVSGYGTEGQGRFVGAAEWYDAEAGEWTKEDGVWEAAEMGGAACVTATADGRIWAFDCGDGGGRRAIREYEGEGKGWREVAAAAEGMKSSLCAVAVGGERVFVVSGDGDGDGDGEEVRAHHNGWIMEMGSKKWTRVETPIGFSGFAYSAAALRI